MRKKIVVIMCALLLAMPVLSFSEKKNGPNPNASAYEHANENARFKRNGDVFNNKKNKAKRARKLAKKKAAAAVEEKKKAEEAQDKGEGQVKLKF